MSTVVIASPLEEEHIARIRAVDGVEVLYDPRLVPAPRYVADHKGVHPSLDDEQLGRWRSMLARADVLFDFDWWEPAELRRNAPGLSWIQATSSGIGQVIDRLGVDPSGLILTTAAGVHKVPLAEFSLTGILYFVKDVAHLRGEQLAHRWERYTSRQLRGMHAVVVGMGGVGQEAAALLSAAGMRVTGVGRDGKDLVCPGAHEIVGMSLLDSVLPSADAVVLCLPLTDETRHTLDARRLSLLPQGAILVNIARGGVVDERAMLDALQSGHLGGAALDVFAVEPLPPESPFWAREDVLISPHSASTVASENRLITDIFIDNLHAYLAGKPMRNVYDPARGY